MSFRFLALLALALFACSRAAPASLAAPAPVPSSAPFAGEPRHATASATRPPNPGETSRINSELMVKGVGPDAFVVTHEPFVSANVLVVRMPDGTVVLCSSPVETQATRALVGWVHAALAPSHIVAINTHFHVDGTGGNEAYRELGVVTYASDHTQALLAEKGQRTQAATASGFNDIDKRRRVETTKITPAERTFPEHDGLLLTFGGEEVRVLYPGRAHSPDNVLVFFPAKQLLFGGCMIKAVREIGYIGDADLDHWEQAIEFARGLGAKLVVPGHGAVSGPDLFDVTISAVRDARSAAHE
jgi:glyoxylase-like metal-dependent hydrolase (beta-lactamase superfamily II)